MSEVLTYYGTDGNITADLKKMLDSHCWNEDETRKEYRGKSEYYTGNKLNEDHNWSFRSEHHVPFFRRRVDELDASFLVERWYTFDESLAPEGKENYDLSRHMRGIVHHRPSQEHLIGLIKGGYVNRYPHASQQDSDYRSNRFGRLDFVPDLPSDGLSNELVVEGVIPYESPEGLWADPFLGVEFPLLEIDRILNISVGAGIIKD